MMQQIWERTGEWPVAYESGTGHVAGMLHLPTEASGRVPAVLFCHGFTGGRATDHRMFVNLARRLAAEGVASLRIDFRGSGESSGEFEDMTIESEVQDALGGLEFLRNHPRVAPAHIGMVGLSLGGCIAAIASGRGAALRALALWAPVAHPWSNFMGGLDPLSVGTLPAVADRNGWPVGRGFAEGLLSSHPLREILGCEAPVLLIHGDKDALVPPSASEQYARVLNEAGRTVRRVVVEGADHTFNSILWTESVFAETREWLLSHL